MDNCDKDTVTGKFGGTVTIGGIDYQIFADVPTTPKYARSLELRKIGLAEILDVPSHF